MPHEALPPLIAGLSSVAGPLNQGANPLEVISTHISWVLLTREYAYKIKKPVNFGFVDFSSLEKRCFYCHEELRLNRRFTQGLYLEVIAIYGSAHYPTLAPESTDLPIEYAIKLSRFDQRALAVQLIEENRLTPALLEGLAETLAQFHGTAQRAPKKSPYGKANRIQTDSDDNFALLASLNHPEINAATASLRHYAQREFQRIAPLLKARKKNGYIRECHGDLHLGNLVRFNGQLMPFDCIEFNPALSWIDVINDLAFLCMDLAAHEQHSAVFQLLNRYLELSGDYAGMAVFRYYSVYRALVRAKIAYLNHPDALLSDHGNSQLQRYLNCGVRLSSPDTPTLYITHGFSGSGKSWLARRLAPQLAAIRISSDVERKRLHGFAALDNTKSSNEVNIYTRTATQLTYTHLYNTAKMLLRNGYNTLIDATFLIHKHRQRFARLALNQGADFKIIDVQASREQLEARIQTRLADKNDASEADLEILAMQIQYAEPLTETEKSQRYLAHDQVDENSTPLEPPI